MKNLTPKIGELLQSVLDAPADSSIGQLRDSEAIRLGITVEESAALMAREASAVDAVYIADESDDSVSAPL